MLSLKQLFVFGVGGAAVTIALGCSTGTSQHHVQWQANGMPRHSDPNNPWWRYQFVYHPREQVYYEPTTATYFWFDNNAWHEGPELPHQFTLEAKLARIVYTWHEKPYMAHNTATAMGSPVKSIRPEFPSGDMLQMQTDEVLTIAGEDQSFSSTSDSNSDMTSTSAEPSSDNSSISDWTSEWSTTDWTTDDWSTTDGSEPQ
jgi:hypothetical protein